MNVSGLSAASSFYAATVSRSGGDRASPVAAKDKSEQEKSGQLSPEDVAQVAKLKQVDRQVRAHEAAHLAASGGMATSGASFTYQKGPDGVSYAVGGEVSINTSSGRTPEETIARARTIRAAALAPADPSGQDRAVAAAASQMEQQARMELSQQAKEGGSPEGRDPDKVQRQVAGFYAAGSKPSASAINTYA